MASPFAGPRIAKVTRVIPEAHACDLIFLDDLSRAPMTQIVAGVSSDTGHVDLPEPDVDPNQPAIPTKKRDLYAVVLSAGGVPLVIGFLPPQVSQMLFRGRKNFRINRHGSDVYSTLEDDGSLTMAWPNGTYLKVGADPAKEDLSGLDFDAKWKIARNTAVAPHVRLVVKDATGAQTAAIEVTPQGYLALDLSADLVLAVAGSLGGEVNSVELAVPGGAHVAGELLADTLKSGTGASGSFTTPSGAVVTVQAGIITNII